LISTVSCDISDEIWVKEQAVPDRRKTVILAPDPRSASEARGFVRELCADTGVGQDTCQAVELLVSETVTNAILHARTEIRVTVSVDVGRVRVEVGDDDPRPPVPQTPDLYAVGGRGIPLVAATASAWGVNPGPTGKIVWFEIVS
jgi:anti-sigma regulatory factor (Ser/Thr protein kinase)